MKREKFLWPLTQSHHRALVTAKRVRELLSVKAPDELESNLEKASAEVKRLFAGELQRHFRDEEKMLILFEERVGREDPDCLRLRLDHELLESLVPGKTKDTLLLFAETIVMHIRFEEGQLFGRIEKAFTEDEKKSTGGNLSISAC